MASCDVDIWAGGQGNVEQKSTVPNSEIEHFQFGLFFFQFISKCIYINSMILAYQLLCTFLAFLHSSDP